MFKNITIIFGVFLYFITGVRSDIDFLKYNFTNMELTMLLIIIQTFLIIIILFYNMGFANSLFNQYNDILVIKKNKKYFYCSKIIPQNFIILILTLIMCTLFVIVAQQNVMDYSFLNFGGLVLVILAIVNIQNIVELYLEPERALLGTVLFLIINFTFYDSGYHNMFFFQYYFIEPSVIKIIMLVVFNIVINIMQFIILSKKDRLGVE